MKVSAIIVFSAAASAAVVERRQLPGGVSSGSPLGALLSGGLASLMPSIKMTKRDILKPLIPDSDVKRARLTYGPFKLKAAKSKDKLGNFFSLDPQGTSYAYMAPDFPTDITVLSTQTDIVYENGEPISNANGVYNHHVFVINTSKEFHSSIECQGSRRPLPAMNTVTGMSADLGPENSITVTERPITGISIAKGNKIFLTVDLVNYGNQTKEVFFTTDMQYIEGKQPGLLETSTHLIPVGACENKFIESMFAKPPKDRKQWSIKGGGMIMKDNGKLKMVRGHLHDGGVGMTFRLNGKDICNSKAEYNASAVATGHSHSDGPTGAAMADEGMMSGMTGCTEPVAIKKGDEISVEAFYDVEKHPAREHIEGGMSEAMALAVIQFGREVQ